VIHASAPDVGLVRGVRAGRGPAPPARYVGARPSPTLPTGWRWESYHHVEIGVPASWPNGESTAQPSLPPAQTPTAVPPSTPSCTTWLGVRRDRSCPRSRTSPRSRPASTATWCRGTAPDWSHPSGSTRRPPGKPWPQFWPRHRKPARTMTTSVTVRWSMARRRFSPCSTITAVRTHRWCSGTPAAGSTGSTTASAPASPTPQAAAP
jgi:hypothetical protein